MADITDVENVLSDLIVGLVYPNGTSSPSIVTVPVKVYPGWPDPQQLESDLKPTGGGSPPTGPATALHITVFPTNSERNTTRYQPKELQTSANVTTYTLSAAGQAITVGGSVPSTYIRQNLAVFVNGLPYIASSTAGQTPAQIASALQALIVVGVAGTTVSGPVITLPAGARLGPLRVGTVQTMGKEVRRTEKVFQIIVWADDPANRSALAQAIDPVFSDTPFITMADGFAARLRYRSTMDIDTDQKQGIYRRDLFYSVEYATVLSEIDTEIVAVQTNVDDSFGDLIETSWS